VPTYQYACTVATCGHQFDTVQAFSDNALTECPQCAGRLRKVWGSIGVVFKGSGFYRNDSRNEAKNGNGKNNDGKNGEGKGGDAKSAAKDSTESTSGTKASSDTATSTAAKSSGDSTASTTSKAPKSGSDSTTAGKRSQAPAATS